MEYVKGENITTYADKNRRNGLRSDIPDLLAGSGNTNQRLQRIERNLVRLIRLQYRETLEP